MGEIVEILAALAGIFREGTISLADTSAGSG
jgi:hypothetical protein